MHGPIYTAIGVGFFPYARMEILRSYDHDGATGYPHVLHRSDLMNFNFFADEDCKVPMGNRKRLASKWVQVPVQAVLASVNHNYLPVNAVTIY